jgi:hypothetical protein
MKIGKYVKLSLLALVALLPLVAMVACSSIKPKIDAGIAAAQKVSDDAGAVIEQGKAVAATLPSDDPLKGELSKRIEQAEKFKQQADQYIAAAKAAETAMNGGVIDPNAAAAIGLLPYGSYAVAGLSILAALIQRAKANGTLDDLTNVVKSWEAAGPPLTDADKAKVAAIQGEKTSAVVDGIKEGAGLNAAPVAVAPPKT